MAHFSRFLHRASFFHFSIKPPPFPLLYRKRGILHQFFDKLKREAPIQGASRWHLGNRNYLFLLRAFIRCSWFRICLRMRRLLGVTSSSSSGARNSRQPSRLSRLMGTRRSASSEPEARVLVRCLVLQTLTSTSSPVGV